MVKRKEKEFIIVAYDVTDDRRRNKISKTMVQYGLRCNESVFECMLTEAKTIEMKRKLKKLTNDSEDSVLIYSLCMPCTLKRESIGKKVDVMPEIVVV